MRTYLCSRTPKSENSKRINDREEFLKLFRDYADSTSDEVLRFEFSKRYYVEIAHTRSEGFFLNCFHEQYSFETLVPYDGVKTGFTIEEFLDDFWNHQVRQKYNFDENVEIRHASFTAKFRFPWLVLFPGLFFVLPFVFHFIEDKPFNPEATKRIMWILLAVTTPYWILLLQYIYYSWSAELRISSREKLVVFRKGNSETAIRFSEITQIRIIRNGERPWIGHWSYMRIVAGPEKRIIVTDFLYAELEKIAQVLGIEPIHEPSFYPLILQKKKSSEDVAEEREGMLEKAEELEQRWKNKSKEELQAIIDSKNEYAAHAIEAAERLLKQRAK
jgi:hypothetical protein